MDGWKESGVAGRFGGAAGILKYCRPQTVTTPRLPNAYQRHVLWFPYTPLKALLLGRIMRALAATGFRRFRP